MEENSLSELAFHAEKEQSTRPRAQATNINDCSDDSEAVTPTRANDRKQSVFQIISAAQLFLELFNKDRKQAVEVLSLFPQHDIKDSDKTSNLVDLGKVAGLLVSHQIVAWSCPNPDFIYALLNATDVEKFIYELYSKDDYRIIRMNINICKHSSHLQDQIILFEQTITAFEGHQFALACLGFTAIIDSLLSKVSTSFCTNMKKRLKIIENKLAFCSLIESEEIPEFLLFVTLWLVIGSLSNDSSFSTIEPSELNRHWIMHGRTHRGYSELDCMKLLNIIFCLILVNNYVIDNNPLTS